MTGERRPIDRCFDDIVVALEDGNWQYNSVYYARGPHMKFSHVKEDMVIIMHIDYDATRIIIDLKESEGNDE